MQGFAKVADCSWKMPHLKSIQSSSRLHLEKCSSSDQFRSYTQSAPKGELKKQKRKKGSLVAVRVGLRVGGDELGELPAPRSLGEPGWDCCTGDSEVYAAPVGQTLQGSFSAVSKPSFEST